MNSIPLLLLFIITLRVQAGTFRFYNSCDETPYLTIESKYEGISLGEATLKILEQENIPYTGTVQGLKTINTHPRETLDIINDTQMRAFGLCYALNDVIPDKMPHEVILKSSDTVEWFVGYSFYDQGTWSQYCRRSYLLRPNFLCD